MLWCLSNFCLHAGHGLSCEVYTIESVASLVCGRDIEQGPSRHTEVGEPGYKNARSSESVAIRFKATPRGRELFHYLLLPARLQEGATIVMRT